MRTGRGFSLIELAVALFLLALLFGTVVMPLQTQVLNRRIAETDVLLHRAREALLGYASANGYFPCPADETSAGREPDATDHITGSCPAYFGFLPGAALGIQHADAQGYALDAWGSSANRIRYAVATQTVGGIIRPFTRTNGLRAAGIANLGDPAASFFHVCSSAAGVVASTSCGTAGTLVSTAPVVLWSVGENAATGGISGDEAQNPNPNGGSADRIFVSRPKGTAGTTGTSASGEFDDQLAWIPMPTLISRMVSAGQLP